MRKKLICVVSLILILLISITITGCDKTEDSVSKPEQIHGSASVAPPLQVIRNVYTETFRDDADGSILLEAKIIIPEIKNPQNNSSINAINKYYRKQFDHFKSKVLSEGLKNARDDKKMTTSGDYEFRSHMYERDFQVYYNANNLLSILNLQYLNTGGAHPNSFRQSDNFDLKTGKKLVLREVLGGSKEEALEKVYSTVMEKIKTTEGTDEFMWKDTYQNDLREFYSDEDFLLKENSLLFYYQLYTLLPYAGGYPEFELPYDQFKTNLKISALPVKEQERDLYCTANQLIDRNQEAYFEIFGLSTLKTDIPADGTGSETIFPVTEKFISYDELEQYVQNTYVKKEADFLLHKYRNGIYINKNGKLYKDISKDAGVGYYVNWNQYRYEISNIQKDSAVIKIYAKNELPSGTKDITINLKMIKENGSWLLEKMTS